MPLEHIGVGVPDVDVAKVYFDELMPMVGFQPCFGNGYCPADSQGTQLFLFVPRLSAWDCSFRTVELLSSGKAKQLASAFLWELNELSWRDNGRILPGPLQQIPVPGHDQVGFMLARQIDDEVVVAVTGEWRPVGWIVTNLGCGSEPLNIKGGVFDADPAA